MASKPDGFVDSADGTRIAYWREGKGPVLLIVHGAGNFHGLWDAMLPLLAPPCSMVTIDRRGRGASGDKLPYAIDQDFEDVVAVAEAIGPLCVLGHSFGGPIALEAALRSRTISSLIIYEGWPAADEVLTVLPDFVLPMEALIAEGRFEESVEYGEPPEEIAEYRKDPLWPSYVNATATFPREVRAWLQFWAANPVGSGRWDDLRIPILPLYGEQNPNSRDGAMPLAANLADARIQELPGQGHRAHVEAPKVLAAAVLPFVRSANSR